MVATEASLLTSLVPITPQVGFSSPSSISASTAGVWDEPFDSFKCPGGLGLRRTVRVVLVGTCAGGTPPQKPPLARVASSPEPRATQSRAQGPGAPLTSSEVFDVLRNLLAFVLSHVKWGEWFLTFLRGSNQ